MQTLPYRSPEIVLKANYSYPIDMWSLGCIIYELLTHNVLFNYGYQKKNLAKALAINKKFSSSMFSEIRDMNSIHEDILTMSPSKISSEEKCFIFPKLNYDFEN
jgi:serine/threonine protein kinase